MRVNTPCLRACACAIVVHAAVPMSTSGQTSEVVLSTTTTGPPTPAYLSGSGRVILIQTLAPLDGSATEPGSGLYLYDRDAPAWRSIPGPLLLEGVPSFYPNEEVHVTALAISTSGRYVAYAVDALLDQYTGYRAAIARYDVQTRTVAFVYRPATPTDAAPLQPAMSADGSTFAWLRVAPEHVEVEVARPGEQPRVVGHPCRNRGVTLPQCLYAPALSARGDKVLYIAGPDALDARPEALAVVDTATGVRQAYPEFTPAGGEPRRLVTNSDATFVAAPAVLGLGGVFDVARRRLDTLDRPAPALPLLALDVGDDGVTILAREPGDPSRAILYDRADGRDVQLGSDFTSAWGLSDDGGTALTLDTPPGPVSELRVWTLDADGDAMSDAWETRYGLSPSDPDDALVDSDGDGRTNLQEFVVRSHPTAAAARLFAEGAAGSFFDTLVHVFNHGTDTATLVVGYLGADGTRTSRAALLPPKQRTMLASCCLPTLTSAEFAIVVESDAPVTAEREMYWDRVSGYASHAATGGRSAAREWHFAEGATIGGLQLFYLLANPGQVDVTVDVEFLLPSGSSIARQYVVPANSRRTVWVNQEGAPLDHAEVAAHIASSAPIVAERATYLTRQGQVFAAGSVSMGAQAPATAWTFAEGATGAWFDTFILLANPLPAAAHVDARYLLPDGVVITRTYTVAPRSRFTIWVDKEHVALTDTPVSTTLSSDSPVVAERAMWWPGDAADWTESHTEIGATTAGTRWAVAAADAGPGSASSTFVLLGNATAAPGRARVTLYGPQGVVGTRDYDMPPTSRTTAWLVQDFPAVPAGTYGAIVESLAVDGQPATPIVVERASYSPDLRSGRAVAATRLAP